METTAIYTVVKMMEILPESTQNRVLEHLREYLADLEDEAEWDELFAGTQPQLAVEAQRVRQEIKEGSVEPLDYNRL